MADAVEMIQRCHRHQHPEDYGGQEVSVEWGTVMRSQYGRDHMALSSEVNLPPEPMGTGERLPDPVYP